MYICINKINSNIINKYYFPEKMSFGKTKLKSDTFEKREKQSCFASDEDRIKLSKKISCLLRHTPQLYNLTLDKEGWASVDVLVDEYNKRHDENHKITAQHLKEMSDKCDKGRFEIKDKKIRALYGHTISNKIEKPIDIDLQRYKYCNS